jgi:hypothetical protein
MRDNDALLEIFREAFRPLACHAHVGDYGKQIPFKVLDRAGKPVREGRYPLTHMRPARDVLQERPLGKAINNVKNNGPELLN